MKETPHGAGNASFSAENYNLNMQEPILRPEVLMRNIPPSIVKQPDIGETLQQRATTNGDYRETSRIIQNLKAACKDSPNWAHLPHYQKESIEMIVHKIGRILSGDPNHVDHWHDICGYAKLVEDILNDKPR